MLLKWPAQCFYQDLSTTQKQQQNNVMESEKERSRGTPFSLQGTDFRHPRLANVIVVPGKTLT